MMKQFKLCSVTFMLALVTLAFPFSLQALEIDQSSNIFKFQQKLAQNGNVTAQYKLGTMYETGDGVTADIELAKHWYDLAAKAGLETAAQRQTYIDVKQQGFDKTKHSVWLSSVKKEAELRKPEAVLLLAQLYRHGLGVEKDLKKSLVLLKQVRILGNANAENEMAAVKAEIEQTKKAEQIRQAQLAKERERLAQSKHEEKQQQELALLAEKEKKAEAEKLSEAEKIRRYEEARMQLLREQQLIDEQQSWATGGEVANVDDEF